MYYYEMLTWDYVYDCSVMLLHDKLYSEQEFSIMCAKSFGESYSMRREYFKDDIMFEKYMNNEKDSEAHHSHISYGDLLEYAVDYMCTVYGFKKIVTTEAFTLNFGQTPADEYDDFHDMETTNHNLIKSHYENKRFILIEKRGFFI